MGILNSLKRAALDKTQIKALLEGNQIAAHESLRTTKLYDRTQDEIALDEVERIRTLAEICSRQLQ